MTMGRADSKEQFNRHAEHYANSVPHSSGESLRVLTEFAALGRYDIGLDIATGPGFTAFAIAPFCKTVIASDIAEGMLKQAAKIAADRNIQNTRFEVINAQDISYPDATFDIITCRTAPHHFSDIPQFLIEVHRTLKPDGTFLLCDTTTSENPERADWHQRAEALRDPSHAYAPAPSEWRQLVTNTGFEITHEQPTQVNMTFWDWVERSGTSQPVINQLHQDFSTAPDAIKNEYGIARLENNDFKFHWPVFTCRSLKR